MASFPAPETSESAPPEPRPGGPAPRPWARDLAFWENLSAAAFVLLVYALYAYAYGRTPIFAGDTDVWYHLNSGRYFWTHLTPPRDNFFSFLRPVRPWIDYFWLFQALVYKVYSVGGYYGLVLYRLVAFLAAETAVLLLFLRGRRDRATPLLWVLGFFFLFGLVLSTRYYLVRPHTLSYLFLAIFLLVLECGRKWSFLLPPLALLWVNVHGITYPVLFLVCLAYLGELAWRRLRQGELEGPDLRLALLLTACLFAVYATPHGSRLLPVPFVSTRYAAQYINELSPVAWKSFLSADVERLAPSSRTAFHVILIATLGCAAVRAWRRTLAPRHLLLFLGAAFLLTKGTRMGCEFSLLSAPLLALGPGGARPRAVPVRRAARIGAIAVLAAAQFSAAYALGWSSWKFPFSPRNLPVGVTRFLQKVGPGGRLLNDHNSAGYLQWELYPRYTLFMDMEVPYLFTDDDMFLTVNAFRSKEVFGQIVARYRPDFVSVPIANKKFPELAKEEGTYRPVFFDDAEVLYVDAKRHPALAARYELRELAPHELTGESVEDLLKDWDEDAALRELRRIDAVFPDCGIVNQVLAKVSLRRKDFGTAERYADRLISSFPEAAQGYKLKGDALQGRGAFRAALSQYDEAIARADGNLAAKIHVEVGQCYRALGDYPKAYRAFSRGVAVYSPDATFKELYYLGSAAYLTGKAAEAEMLYRFALTKTPASEGEWRKRLETHLRLLERGRAPEQVDGTRP